MLKFSIFLGIYYARFGNKLCFFFLFFFLCPINAAIVRESNEATCNLSTFHSLILLTQIHIEYI